ncbi:hypothetical protein GCM10022286_30360 [Gryllotalpicola daejeonensis]|uniref:Uncharacterized protein n=1 Tax=Gryllotalpicola daejeonensis TaxID=993087 RepID=A0ABP7ZP71_9MICO
MLGDEALQLGEIALIGADHGEPGRTAALRQQRGRPRERHHALARVQPGEEQHLGVSGIACGIRRRSRIDAVGDPLDPHAVAADGGETGLFPIGQRESGRCCAQGAFRPHGIEEAGLRARVRHHHAVRLHDERAP